MTISALRAIVLLPDRTGHDSSGFYKRKMYTHNEEQKL